jgi:hypothetical protein
MKLARIAGIALAAGVFIAITVGGTVAILQIIFK